MDRLAGLSLNLSPSPEQVADWLTSGVPLACDVETPEQRNDTVLMCGLARSAREALVFEWREPFVGLMRAWLESPAAEVVGHNFAFDARAFWLASGIRVEAQVFDTMAAAACVWPPVADRKHEDTSRKRLRLPFHSLPLCVLRTHEREAYWKEPGSAYGQAFYQVAFGLTYSPYEWPRLYCALDCLRTYSLKLKLQDMLCGT